MPFDLQDALRGLRRDLGTHGVTVEQARADLEVVQGRIATRVSEQAGQPATMRALVIPLAGAVVGGARRGLVLLMGAIVAVLLMACANLANSR